MYKITCKNLNGNVTVPPSKSIAHRAIICAALSRGKSCHINNVDFNDDVKATIECMKELGTYIEEQENALFIDGNTTFFRNYLDFYVGASGSTLRFLIPISLIYQANVRIRGEKRLAERSLQPYYDIFEHQQLNYLYKGDALDLLIEGYLLPDTFKLPGNVSSQFISGLLFACPLMRGDSVIELTSPLESKGYVDLTLSMLNQFGIEVKNENYQKFFINGNQHYIPQDITIEADYSQAAYYLVANKLGANIKIDNLNPDSIQGDKVILDYLENNQEIDVSNCPDLAPVLALYCSLTEGKHVIKNCERLKIKECDRLAVTVEVLDKLGAHIHTDGHAMFIEGVETLHGNTVSTYNDHRIAMMCAIASLCCNGEIIIDNKDCVSKSYPDFWNDFISLGGQINEC